MSDLLLRTNKGAELLDTQFPGWSTSIDRKLLSMQWGDVCILGQLFNSYYEGLTVLNMSYQDAYEYGFTVCTEKQYLDSDYSAPEAEWLELTLAWNDEITQRG